MQSKTEGFRELEAYVAERRRSGSFEFYEEYSHRHILETFQTRRDAYDKAGFQGRERLEIEAQIEVRNFCSWLESKKKLTPFEAHYYSISLKSLLSGLPLGLYIAQLFNIVLARVERSK